MIDALAITVDGTPIAGLRSLPDRTESGASHGKLLCLHGWLDNASSFTPLMPWLSGFEVVAIDLPGHGLSAHLPHAYSLLDMVIQIHRVIDTLGWTDCHLVGHSLGGCIAPLMACADPSRIRSLTLIDAAGPISEEAIDFPARLERVLRERRESTRIASRHFATVDDAVQARLRASRMTPTAARLIVERQLRCDTDGYRWRYDPRLRTSSSCYLTEAHVRRVFERLNCPVLTIIASQGVLAAREQLAERLACIHRLSCVRLDGNHHLHMDDPQPVASAMLAFFGSV